MGQTVQTGQMWVIQSRLFSVLMGLNYGSFCLVESKCGTMGFVARVVFKLFSTRTSGGVLGIKSLVSLIVYKF
ncbi:hypothetical protein HanIR_Chr11g0538041 [Helianthus annuus]|nr:hypothetical protein HanIR_Chr11g0538041 [Helianthus annuus]